MRHLKIIETISTATPMIVSYLMSSGSLATASVAQLATFAILARALGPAEFGLFVQISAVTAIAVQICVLGASDCVLRRVSREPESYPLQLGHNLLLIGLTGIVLVFGGVAMMPSWSPFYFPSKSRRLDHCATVLQQRRARPGDRSRRDNLCRRP